MRNNTVSALASFGYGGNPSCFCVLKAGLRHRAVFWECLLLRVKPPSRTGAAFTFHKF